MIIKFDAVCDRDRLAVALRPAMQPVLVRVRLRFPGSAAFFVRLVRERRPPELSAT
ncbi:hypothetical protein ABZ807_08770 [Micromonospora sp. NPDC047548]|uniref:hypothetical protein n=1 Tax=Micromonospora sp. NPDC047548 TaxID=3155624 RepID=UPI0033D25E78